jgi:hypothetical protein
VLKATCVPPGILRKITDIGVKSGQPTGNCTRILPGEPADTAGRTGKICR